MSKVKLSEEKMEELADLFDELGQLLVPPILNINDLNEWIDVDAALAKMEEMKALLVEAENNGT